jgi:hypothetical protein
MRGHEKVISRLASSGPHSCLVGKIFIVCLIALLQLCCDGEKFFGAIKAQSKTFVISDCSGAIADLQGFSPPACNKIVKQTQSHTLHQTIK